MIAQIQKRYCARDTGISRTVRAVRENHQRKGRYPIAEFGSGEMGSRDWPDETTQRWDVCVVGNALLLERKGTIMGANGGCLDPPVASLSSPESKSSGERRRTPAAPTTRRLSIRQAATFERVISV